MIRIITTVALVSTLALAGCHKKVPEPVGPKVTASQSGPKTTQAAVAEIVDNFSRVQFTVDSAALDKGSRQALDRNAELLQAHPNIRVEVQGHADERGTVDYNLALGQRRAYSVRDYLMLAGVAGPRLTAVSFGEEVPLVRGATETAWSQNRRAEFRITVPDGAIAGTTN